MLKKLALSLAFACVANAQSGSAERVLVPIYLPTPVNGAFGSVWASELRILNAGATPATIENFGPSCIFDPCLPEPLSPGVSIPGDYIRGLQGGNGIPGAILLVRPEVVGQFSFQLRVRDISRTSRNWGTSIPVVRERHFTNEPVNLFNVPLERQYRQMLRIYAPPFASGVVRVRVFGANSEDRVRFSIPPDPLLTEATIALRWGSESQPSYAELSNLAALPGVSGYQQVRVQVEPESGQRIWAMISVTNDETQEVTTITPNPQ